MTRTAPDRRRGRPPGHSLEAILDEAVRILDAGGERALTLRGLAAGLGAGVGSLYWYVSGKDELLDRATDRVLQQVLERTDDLPPDPYAALTALADVLYDSMHEHPWVARYLMRNPELQPASMRLYERFGQQTRCLNLTTRQRFHAVSALIGFVAGVGADVPTPPPEAAAGGLTQEQALQRYADVWRGLDPDDFPFVHEIADEFARHHDAEQFAAGIQLILAGIRSEAGDRAERVPDTGSDPGVGETARADQRPLAGW